MNEMAMPHPTGHEAQPLSASLRPVPPGLNHVMSIAAETWKGLQLMWTFKFNVVSEVVGLFMVFLGINFFVGNGAFNSEDLAFTLVGFCIWTYSIFAISNMSYALREEQQQGTIEQMFMGSTPFAALLFGRTLSNFVWTTAVILLGGGTITLAFGLDLGLNWRLVPVLGLTMFGLYGLGFVVAGLTILFKNILSFANLIQNVLLFLNGAIVPVTVFPAWMTTATRALPSTLSIEVARLVTLDDLTLATVWTDGLLPLLVLHSLIWFVLGLSLYLVAERIARRKGLLGQF
ncbi:MAG: ABC transporter permease [Caldilineaceae bacterium SB0664_bin_22]|nr:ABC transporter permease [Caldilineaceae bacterium SB0664_bin_22]